MPPILSPNGPSTIGERLRAALGSNRQARAVTTERAVAMEQLARAWRLASAKSWSCHKTSKRSRWR